MQCTLHIPHVHVHAYNYCTFYLYVSGLKYFVVRRCVVLCLLSPSHSSFLLLSFPLFPCSFLLPFSLSLSLSLQVLQVPAWVIMTGAAPLLSLCSQGVEERSNSLHPQKGPEKEKTCKRNTHLLYLCTCMHLYTCTCTVHVDMYIVCACTCTCMCTTCTCYY